MGAFVLLLLEKADALDEELLVMGFGKQSFDVAFGGEPIYFCLNISLGHRHEGIRSAHWQLRLSFYKKRWVRETVEAMPSPDWMTLRPLAITDLADELTDHSLDGVVLGDRYPKVVTRKMIRIIGEETRALDDHFTYEASPGRSVYLVVFRDPEMRQHYLDDGPVFRDTIQPILRDAIPRINARLEALNRAADTA